MRPFSLGGEERRGALYRLEGLRICKQPVRLDTPFLAGNGYQKFNRVNEIHL